MNVTLWLMFFIIQTTLSFWPPAFKINLYQTEVFEIAENIEEDEMIPPDLVKEDDDDKYFRLHQIVRRYNKDQFSPDLNRVKKVPEHNFDLEDPVPWEGGFVDRNGNFISDNENLYFVNDAADEKNEHKRQDQEILDVQNRTRNKEEHYDYREFKAEYAQEVQIEAKDNNTLNFTEVREDESVEDAIETIVSGKNVTNCTEEEARGIGFSALKCLWKDSQLKGSDQKSLKIIEKVLKIVIIWFCVYAVIAIPCWCQRGWCCCCCRCRICRPRNILDEAKRFYAENPVGVLYKEAQKFTYKPTPYEQYAQKRLEKALLSL